MESSAALNLWCSYGYSSLIIYFFFSSRRRHTRCSRDWSSDVCSSDLGVATRSCYLCGLIRQRFRGRDLYCELFRPANDRELRRGANLIGGQQFVQRVRSEERRVGKACRCGGSAELDSDED